MTPVHVLPVLSRKVYHITNFLKGGGGEGATLWPVMHVIDNYIASFP